MALVLVDTNVVVSGVLAGIRESPNRLILDAMISGRLRFILSEALLAEYRDVLLRPAIVQRHGLTLADVDVVLEELVLNAQLHEPLPGPADSSVPGDEHVLVLLRAVPEAVLVTGDHLLHAAVPRSGPALTPAEFATRMTRP